MGKKYKKRSREIIESAKEEILRLFSEAEKAFSYDKKLANRYVDMARRIGMKCKIRIPPELQRRFCKHCYSFLVPGKNLRVRMQKGHVVYYCLECKKFMRFPHNLKSRIRVGQK
jgi:ribonuclease P protein subunit RPR2